MEKIIDFDEWLSDYQLPTLEYVAVFDTDTGAVLSVGPSHAFIDNKNKIVIDKEIAESIIEGSIKIGSCIIDLEANTLQIAEIKNIFKIDDVLHRIVTTKYANFEKFDLFITYVSKTKKLKIQLSDDIGGTKKLPKKFQSAKPKKIIWDGDTEMRFLITDYNDPNLIFEMFSVKINELIGKTKTIDNIDYDKFSVYTCRLFKNYVIEYK
jgi:hypothetical protein